MLSAEVQKPFMSLSLNDMIAAQYFCSSAPAHVSGTWEPGNSRDNVKVGEMDKQVMAGIEIAAEGEGITVAHTHSPPVQLTPVPVNTALNHIAVSMRTLYWLMASHSMSMESHIPTHQ